MEKSGKVHQCKEPTMKSSGFSCGPTRLPRSVSPEFLQGLRAAGARESLVRAVASKSGAKQ